MQLDLLDKDSPVAGSEAGTDALVKRLPASSVVSAPVSAFSDTDDEKAPGAMKTISEVAAFLDVPQHVLRFWESRFSQIRPLKLRGGRRYYRPEDIDVLMAVKHLLYQQGYTIKGAKKAFAKKAPPEPVAVASAPVATPPKPPVNPVMADKQQSQLAVLRQELIGLRDVLKPYIKA